MDHLDALEQQSVYILREAYKAFPHMAMMWSIGKDSTVLLWLARKAFFDHVPFPLVHVDTGYEIPEVLEYRDRLALEYGLTMVIGQDKVALAEGRTNPATRNLPDGDPRKLTMNECCKILRTGAQVATIMGTGTRYKMNLGTGQYDEWTNKDPWHGVIVGARADEEGSRSKERYFSPRDKSSAWDPGDQPPEFWNQFKTDYAPGTHVRIHPLLDWTELNIWEYIKRETIPLVPLYFNRGNGRRFRSLGCYTCQDDIESPARNVDEVIAELASGKLKNKAERDGRKQDHEKPGGLEALRKDGYM